MDTAKMMANAYKLKQAIEAEVIEVEENGIKITIGGDLKIKKISINNAENGVLKDVINNSVRKAQEIQVLKMREMVDFEGIAQNSK